MLKEALSGLKLSRNMVGVIGDTFHLNQNVSGWKLSERLYLYLLKNRLTQLLYHRGLCVKCVQQRQNLACRCGGRNKHCPKCHGTGIFKVVYHTRFTFGVEGVYFSWHQPTDMLTWQPQPIDGSYKSNGKRFPQRGHGDMEIVWSLWWLLGRGRLWTAPPAIFYYELGLSPDVAHFIAAIGKER